ncbi:2',3'-cyclic-nucleotide 3'-phosphodiesterase [Lentinula aciculospora]|uniref:2',3'-cyclic-nucleotide 3'-phosphodiesterase n=1 Tax=Lentinula aciculospora TaxID=153920 RepID=A0A9W9A150_9AGAR|nr:2',3'-cyclic-nucleotide 3'-phosphodiesterase [Lentinula aciculospora]
MRRGIPSLPVVFRRVPGERGCHRTPINLYSMVTLWIVPSDEESAKLRRILSIGSSTTTSSETQSYPAFHPHITLAAPPSSTSLTLEQLRHSIPNPLPIKFPFHFKSVNTGDHYFRSVYIAIQLSPVLISLHADVHASLDLEPRTPMFPHLSLCYITDKDDNIGEERQRWRDQLEASGRIRNTSSEGSGVELNCSVDDAGDDWISELTANEIWFVDCVGPVGSWSVLDKLRLRPK